jgi:hypothetical protein
MLSVDIKYTREYECENIFIREQKLGVQKLRAAVEKLREEKLREHELMQRWRREHKWSEICNKCRKIRNVCECSILDIITNTRHLPYGINDVVVEYLWQLDGKLDILDIVIE